MDRSKATALVLVALACSGGEPARDWSALETAARQEGEPGARAALRWLREAEASEDALAALQARQRVEELAETECVAQVGLLEAGVDPDEAYRRIYRISREDCRAEVEAALERLAEHRPPDEDLMDIDRAEGRACSLIRTAAFGAGRGGIRAVAYFEGECATEARREGDRYVAPIDRFVGSESVPRRFEVGEGGLIAFGWNAEGIVAELEPGAQAHGYLLSDRWIVDVSTRTPLDERAADREIVIVLDPGHGGREHGALFEELEEADLVLDISLRVRRILGRRLPASRVIMTREVDEAVSLEQRTALANAADADLFLSVHLNSADTPVAKGGITTFVLDASDDEQAVRLAARENGTSPHRVTGIQRLIARLHRREQVQHSRRLAERIHEETLRGGRRVLSDLDDRGVKSALFYVLVGARMPAVLLEASFLTKPEEAAALRLEAYREALAAGIAEGIVRYVAEDSDEEGEEAPSPEPAGR